MAKTKTAKKTATKKPRARLRRTKNQTLRIGMSSNTATTITRPFVADGVTLNHVRIFGDRIGTGNPNNKDVHLHSSGYVWQYPPQRVQNSGRDALDVTATCRPLFVKKKPQRRLGTTDDDLTVTIVIDDGSGNPDSTEVTFDEITFQP